MTIQIILKEKRKVVQIGNSCALIIPKVYKKALFDDNITYGTWIVTKDDEGDIHVEVKFSFAKEEKRSKWKLAKKGYEEYEEGESKDTWGRS